MTAFTLRLLRPFAWGVVLLSMASCGSDSSPTIPTNPTDPSITFTITAAGVSPKELRVPAGTRVLFTNTDPRQHEIGSDPHPDHSDCTEINQVGFITTGQTKETGNLVTVRTCGFHDHQNPTSTALMGRIVIQ